MQCWVLFCAIKARRIAGPIDAPAKPGGAREIFDVISSHDNSLSDGRCPVWDFGLFGKEAKDSIRDKRSNITLPDFQKPENR